MRTIFIQERDKINEIMKACKTCFLGMSADGLPYVLPMNFALDGEYVILHSAQSGRMWETIQKNPKVCINWTIGEDIAWQDEHVGCSYRVKSKSVVVEGVVEFETDFDEKVKCLELLMGQYSKRDFKFSAPAVNNVGIIKVKIEHISAKEFGTKATTPWNT